MQLLRLAAYALFALGCVLLAAILGVWDRGGPGGVVMWWHPRLAVVVPAAIALLTASLAVAGERVFKRRGAEA